MSSQYCSCINPQRQQSNSDTCLVCLLHFQPLPPVPSIKSSPPILLPLNLPSRQRLPPPPPPSRGSMNQGGGDMALAQAFTSLADVLSDTGQFKRKFKGDKGQDIKYFLEDFNRHCEINGKDENYKIRAFPLFLEGRAQKLYSRLPNLVKQDFDSASREMMNFFSLVQLPPIKAFKKLHNIKKTSSQTVQEYYEEIIDLTGDIDVSEAQLMAHFISGMPKFIENFLILKEPTDLSEALRLAKQQELVGPDEDDNTILLKNILTKLEGEKPIHKISVMDDPNKTSFLCYFCGEKNHYAANCPKKRDDSYICNFCQKPGHAMASCRRKRQEENPHFCTFCHKPGHLKAFCRKLNFRPPSTSGTFPGPRALQQFQYGLQDPPSILRNGNTAHGFNSQNTRSGTRPFPIRPHQDAICHFCNGTGHTMDQCMHFPQEI